MIIMQEARVEDHGAKSVWIANPEYQRQYSLAEGIPQGLSPPASLSTDGEARQICCLGRGSALLDSGDPMGEQRTHFGKKDAIWKGVITSDVLQHTPLLCDHM